MQAHHPTSFTLEVSLLIPHRCMDCEAIQVANWAAHFARLLAHQGVTVKIILQSARNFDLAPPPQVLWILAPFFNNIELYNVPTELCTDQEHIYTAALSGFSAAHAAALLPHSTNLAALCVSELKSNISQPPLQSVANSIPDIAQLRSLTKLHLTGDFRNSPFTFEPLSQLSSLQDLGLHTFVDTTSCAGVLESSRNALRYVSLAAVSWSLNTYTAMQQIPFLDRLTIKLWRPTADQAALLTSLTAEFIHLDTHQVQHLVGQPLRTLTRAIPAFQVQKLTLWNVNNISCHELASLPSLKSLTIAKSLELTGTRFNTHAGVTELILANCPSVGRPGVQHIISTAFPGLKTCAVQCWGNHSGGNERLASALQPLSRGRNLTCVDLRGVKNLGENAIKKLQSAFQQVQAMGRAEPLVTLYLPVFSMGSFLGHCQSMGEVVECVYAPPFHREVPERGRKATCKRRKHPKLFLFAQAVSSIAVLLQLL